MTDARPGEPERGRDAPAEFPARPPDGEAEPAPRAAAEPASLPASSPPPTPPPVDAPTRPAGEATHDAAPESEARFAPPTRALGEPTPPISNATNPAARARRPGITEFVRERPEIPVEIPRTRLSASTRRDFLLFSAGVLASAAGAWWLLPDRTRGRLAGASSERLDSLAARLGLTRDRAEGVLDRALTFDDDVAEALYSRGRRVRTYDRSQVTPLRNNYDGQTPGPEYLPGWQLHLSGLASGSAQSLSIGDLEARFPLHEQVTRLVCVEGWSAVACWGGLRFADLLEAFPPAPGARWAALRSGVNLDGAGRPDPYYVSIDLETARHPQTLLATRLGGRALPLEHGAPLRLLVPMKLGLKNIKAVTDIAYTASEPPDYWNERGYSKYDGL